VSAGGQLFVDHCLVGAPLVREPAGDTIGRPNIQLPPGSKARKPAVCRSPVGYAGSGLATIVVEIRVALATSGSAASTLTSRRCCPPLGE
jgi:hypothetical protein